MIAYKFLAAGGVGPFSGVAWPAPGAWLEAAGPLATRGIHVCRPDELAHWLHDELWQVETAGAEAEGHDCVVVARARRVRQIDAWTAGGAARFAAACLAHARETADDPVLADGADAASAGYVAVAAHCAALALGHRAGEPAYRAERRWQSAWIARELIGQAPATAPPL